MAYGCLVGAELRDRRPMLVHLAGKSQDRGFLAAEEREDDLFDDPRETLDAAALGLDLFDDGLDVERHRVVELLFQCHGCRPQCSPAATDLRSAVVPRDGSRAI